eukprot:3176637-Pyramimonas_sp.AAC.1
MKVTACWAKMISENCGIMGCASKSPLRGNTSPWSGRGAHPPADGDGWQLVHRRDLAPSKVVPK